MTRKEGMSMGGEYVCGLLAAARTSARAFRAAFRPARPCETCARERGVEVSADKVGKAGDLRGAQRLLYDAVIRGTSSTAELMTVYTNAGFTGESWFYDSMNRLMEQGLVRRGAKKGIYLPAGDDSS